MLSLLTNTCARILTAIFFARAIYGLVFNDTHLVAKDPLKLTNAINKHFFNKPECYFTLFLTIKYLRMFNLSDLSIAL